MAIKFWITFEFADARDFSGTTTTITLGVYGCPVYPVDVADAAEGGGNALVDSRLQRLKFVPSIYALSRFANDDVPPDGQDWGTYAAFTALRRTHYYFRIYDSNCLRFVQFPDEYALPRPAPCVMGSRIEPDGSDDDAADYVTMELLEDQLYTGS
jgi:hypothetical protein